METKYLIFTNPRSGSTALGEILYNYLQKEKNYDGSLGEYFSISKNLRYFELQKKRIVRIRGTENKNTPIKDRLRFLKESNKNYSFELHTWQTTSEIFNFLNGDYHFICLHRKNILEGLLSNAIGGHFDTWESEELIFKLEKLRPNDLILERYNSYSGGYINNIIQHHQYWLPKVSDKSIIYYEDFCDWKSNKNLRSKKILYPFPKIEYFKNKDEIKNWVREVEEKLSWPWPFQE